MTKEKITKQKHDIRFKLKGLELLNVTMNQPEKPLPEPVTFHFKINLEQKINFEKKLVFVVTSIMVSHEKDKESKLGSITTSCIFEVTNLDEFVNLKNQVSFTDETLLSLNEISISTTRGILFSQFRGTFLHQAFLPNIDVKSLKMT